jgi:serine/threonine protein kinase
VAPEVIRELEYSEKVDVWSMAITIIEMMDRVPPLYYLDNTDDIFAEILWGASASFSFAFPTERMKDIVMWMLDTDMRKRPTAKCVLSVNFQILFFITAAQLVPLKANPLFFQRNFSGYLT